MSHFLGSLGPSPPPALPSVANRARHSLSRAPGARRESSRPGPRGRSLAQCWRHFPSWRSRTGCVLVSSGCRNKIPQSGGLKPTHSFLSSGGWRSESKVPEDSVPGKSRFGVWLAKGPLRAVSSHCDEKEGCCVRFLFL